MWNSTPLHEAAHRGHEAMVGLLLEHAADFSARDRVDFTPLHEAAFGGHAAVVRRLLDKGADIESKTSHSWEIQQIFRGVSVEVMAKAMVSYRSNFEIVAMLQAEALRRAKSVAFAMGQQERLGAGSRVRGLDPGVVRIVLEQV